jgi:putative sigma-54 modulation protein
VEITVSSRHTEVSELLRTTTIDKIGRLSRFLEGMDRAEVHFSEEHNRRPAEKEVCEVTMEGHGHHVRCKVSAPDGFAAVDLAVEKLEHQLHKLKTKLVRRNHSPSRRGANGNGHDEVDESEAEALTDANGGGSAGQSTRIVKTKAFRMKPMPPEEAALQMDLLNHDFFFFTNSDTERAAVVYRRNDGTVGLIDEG